MAETEASSGMPIRRDNVGALAWRVVGDDGNPPDFTAVPALFDALMEEGDHEAAFRLRSMVANMFHSLQDGGELPQGRLRRSRIQNMKIDLLCNLLPVLFDFPSAAYELDKFVRAESPRNETQSKVELQTIRMMVEPHVRRGFRVELEDGRAGVVVSERGQDGMADVIPVEEEYAVQTAGSPPPMSYRTMTGRPPY